MKMTLLFTMLVSLSIPAMAEDKTHPAMDPKKQEMMGKWLKASTPGTPHKILASMAGSWKYASQWWEAPNAKPESSNGTSTLKMIMGGRFLQHETKGKAMGMPFSGLGLTGYNNVSGKYETLWLDNMNTGMMHGEGTFDDATKTLSDAGEFSCPMTENKKAHYRGEWKITDHDHMSYSMYGHGMDANGPEFKQMEMAFTRVK